MPLDSLYNALHLCHIYGNSLTFLKYFKDNSGNPSARPQTASFIPFFPEVLLSSAHSSSLFLFSGLLFLVPYPLLLLFYFPSLTFSLLCYIRKNLNPFLYKRVSPSPRKKGAGLTQPQKLFYCFLHLRGRALLGMEYLGIPDFPDCLRYLTVRYPRQLIYQLPFLHLVVRRI